MIIDRTNDKWINLFNSNAEERERIWKKLTLKELQEFIAKTCGINAHYKGNETPLHQAVRYSENAEIIKELIKEGADIHAKNKNGHTPLHLASYINKSIEVIKELIKAGADIEAKGNGGEIPYDLLLYSSWLKNNKDAIALLKP